MFLRLQHYYSFQYNRIIPDLKSKNIDKIVKNLSS